MKASFSNYLYLAFTLLFCSCNTPKMVQSHGLEKTTTQTSDDLGVTIQDSVTFNGFRYDVLDDGIFGRKIIYKDLSAEMFVFELGKISVKVCINRAGLVTYVELNNTETTITEKQILKKFLKSARNYKFEPLRKAPEIQCGTILFTIQKI